MKDKFTKLACPCKGLRVNMLGQRLIIAVPIVTNWRKVNFL